MIAAALLSAIHMLTLALGLGGIVARGRALASPLDDAAEFLRRDVPPDQRRRNLILSEPARSNA